MNAIMVANRDIYDTHGQKAVESGSHVKTYPTVDKGYVVIATPGEPDYEIKVPASFLESEK